MNYIDLNCDMGEGAGNDAIIMPYITSANIACGFHAGDEHTMRQTIRSAKTHKVAIGAHPSFPDREYFGRQEMNLSDSEIYTLINQQLSILDAIAKEEDMVLNHVKPHGALYNQAAKDMRLATVIANAVNDFDPRLKLVGLSGSCLVNAAAAVGLHSISEVFADRTYTDNGHLTPRTQANAMITTEEESIQQVLQMVLKGTVTSTLGKAIAIKAETICLHGDGPHAAAFAERIYAVLQEKGIVLKSL
jgi:UPF0271 protein